MNMKKSVASIIAGVMLGSMALVGCGSSGHQHTEYERVYDTHSNHYVIVTHDYYIHHKSAYRGKPQVVKSPSSAPSATSKTKLKDKVKHAIAKHKAKKAAKRSRRR
jgi:hypothetical protein